jgi:phosphohistidine swiveling domain-containing protein
MIKVTAAKFAETHSTDEDFVEAMNKAGMEACIFTSGESVIYSRYNGTVVSYYHNGMYNVRVPGGVITVDGCELTAA